MRKERRGGDTIVYDVVELLVELDSALRHVGLEGVAVDGICVKKRRNGGY